MTDPSTSASSARPAVPAGVATGIGSLPGTDPRAATAMVTEELPDFPHLVELPDRGPGADLIGRTAAALVELHVDLQPAGWRLVDRPGRDERRGLAWLGEDIDALSELTAGWGGWVKVSFAGPWTLAAELDLPRGHKALRDAGAVRDLADSLAETLRERLSELRGRLGRTGVVVQLDEPMLPRVLAGQVATPSGLSRLPAVEAGLARERLATVLGAAHEAGSPVVLHCCAAAAPVQVMAGAGADAVAVDLAVLAEARLDELAEAMDGGVRLLAGAVPTGGPYDAAAAAAAVNRLGRRLSLPSDLLRAAVTVSPACGLAGRSQAQVLAAYRAASEAARRLNEQDSP